MELSLHSCILFSDPVSQISRYSPGKGAFWLTCDKTELYQRYGVKGSSRGRHSVSCVFHDWNTFLCPFQPDYKACLNDSEFAQCLATVTMRLSLLYGLLPILNTSLLLTCPLSLSTCSKTSIIQFVGDLGYRNVAYQVKPLLAMSAS